MLLKSLVYPKDNLTTINESTTLQEALDILEGTGFRCVPILDESNQIFRGNIYKMHIYRHKANGGDMDLPVTHLLKNATKFISLDTSFFKIFFTIKELPYITVLDEDHHFYGILTHSTLLNMLSQSWNIQTGSYVITVVSTGKRGDLAAMSKIISKFTTIANCITLDVGQEFKGRRTLFTLPAGVDENKLNHIIDHLERKHFEIQEVESLTMQD